MHLLCIYYAFYSLTIHLLLIDLFGDLFGVKNKEFVGTSPARVLSFRQNFFAVYLSTVWDIVVTVSTRSVYLYICM